MKIRVLARSLLLLFSALTLCAQQTNQPAGGSGIQPLTPMKPLTPMRPLGPPPAPSAPAAATTPAASTGASAGEGGAARAEAPAKITTFMTSQVSGITVVDEKGAATKLKYFRIQFKILDPAVTSLDTAAVYLFNQKKELVGSLTQFNQQVQYVGSETKENLMSSYPNMPGTLTGLEKNKNYNLVFTYRHNEIQFKYAVGVIGTKDRVVADTIPGSAKLDDFAFDGKDKLVQ